MDYITLVLYILIGLLGMTILIGYAITLGVGDYYVAGGQEWVWIFFTLSMLFYLVSAGASLFGAYGFGTITMAISLFSDYVLGWVVGDNVTVGGYSGGFTGIKYTAFVSKTIMLTMMAYLAGVGDDGKDTLNKFGSSFIRNNNTSRTEFAKSRFA